MNLLAPAAQYSLAGLKSLLVGPWTPGADYVYASAQLDIITELDPAAIWWPVECSLAEKSCEFGEAYAPDKIGDLYTQTVAVALPGLQVAFRAGLQNLLGKPLLALCQDMRGQWWLFGQDGRLRVPSYAAKSGPSAGDTLTSWVLSGRNSEAARQVALDGPLQIVDYGFNPGAGTSPGGTSPGGTNPGGTSPHTLPFTLA